MKAIIKGKKLSGSVKAPSSKSQVHRMLICAALSDSPTDIRFTGMSKDIAATADCMRALGAGVERRDYGFHVLPIGMKLVACGSLLRCSESGSTLRFLLPVAAALGADASFFTEGRLSERPLAPLDALLADNGCTVNRENNVIFCRGRLCGNDFSIDGGTSSQFVSGLLMALPILGGGKVKVTGRCESKGYISITVDMMRRFGISVTENEGIYTVSGKYESPGDLTAEGDWSSAAFWTVAAALGSDVKILGLDPESLQGDRAVLNLLERMGAPFRCNVDEIHPLLSCYDSSLHSIEFNASDIPDIVPVMAVAACGADGVTEVTGAARLRLKESDRLAAVAEMISSCGGKVTELDDGLSIYGCGHLTGGSVNAHGDHRIAMSAAVLSQVCEGEVIVDGAESVDKSYPDFWKDFVALGGEVVFE